MYHVIRAYKYWPPSYIAGRTPQTLEDVIYTTKRKWVAELVAYFGTRGPVMLQCVTYEYYVRKT